MKTLIIVTHPEINNSIINKRWIEELNKYPEKYTFHELYKTYPDWKIDVAKEQQLINSYDKIIFQFPLYWFSSPPLLKQWEDKVMLRGWAYGSKSGYKMEGKKIALAITLGGDEEDYKRNAKHNYTMQELTHPFEVTFNYVKADYKGFFAYYGIEFNTSDEWIEKSVLQYMEFIDKI